MPVFPLLASGSQVQYPFRIKREERTIVNVSLDGRVTALNDPNGSQIIWDLNFNGLSDDETNSLIAFYQSCEGPLQPFTFLDPGSNLLMFSEDLTQPVWQLNTLLTITPGIDDPEGGTQATRLANTSAGTLTLVQSAAIPGTVQTVFSMYLRQAQGSGIEITSTDGSNVAMGAVRLLPDWQRFSVSSAFASSQSASLNFTVTVPPGVSVDVFGFQVEAQRFPGLYLTSTDTSGVYPNSRFLSQALTVSATGPGQNSVQVSIISKASQ